MATPDANPQAVPDMSVPVELQKGTKLLKVSAKKEKTALFRIDPDQGQVVYESKKSGIIPIESIKEIRSGPQAKYYREQFKLSEALDDRWITIIYIVDGCYKTIHVVADTPEMHDIWLTCLNRLHAIRQGLMTGLGNIEVRDAVWEKQYWKGADKGGDSKLDFAEVESLCHRLNVNLSNTDIHAFFKEADVDNKGLLDFDGFRRFVRLVKKRPDVEKIYKGLGKLDADAFKKFLKETQQSPADGDQLFSKYSPNEPVVSIGAFTRFLLSSDNAPFLEQQEPIWQDMTQPMSEYFVSSSHNTYLIGHQLVGVSTIEGYIRALLHSCRSVELDIYDGDDGEPVIYHGKTLTSQVSVRAVCEAIAKYAFVTSPYAIIISAEVHCGIKQQDVIVEIMTTVFGDRLVQAPLEDRPPVKHLPSPEELKGKFLLKAKNLMVTARIAAVAKEKLATSEFEAEAENTSSSESDDDSSSGLISSIKGNIKGKWRSVRKKEKKPVMSLRLATLLVYTVGIKCIGLKDLGIYSPEHIFSLSESRAKREAGKEMVRHTQSCMVRVYPKGTRVNSTNYEPQMYWAMGAQVVAINWQTFDLGYMINQAMFQRNGRCGYILKPKALLPGGEKLLETRKKYRCDVTIISAQQLPRAKDTDTGVEIIEKSTVDPLVRVSLHIPNWLASPASDKDVEPVTRVTGKTFAVKNNGFNPVWDKKLELPFECVGDMMDLIFVEFTVVDDGENEGGVAKYCVPLGRLGRGYRHLPLHDEQLSQFLFSTLFVKVDTVEL